MDVTGIGQAVATSVDVLDKLGILETVRNKLLNNPDPAGRYLKKVLSEVAKSYQALDDYLINVATLSIETKEEQIDTEKYLRELEGNRIRVRIEETRGHCSIINSIYKRYLTGWFSRLLGAGKLDAGENEQIRELFEKLALIDYNILGAMETLALQLPTIADRFLKLLQQKNVMEFKRQVENLANSWASPRQRLSAGMTTLWRLQADFARVSGGL